MLCTKKHKKHFYNSSCFLMTRPYMVNYRHICVGVNDFVFIAISRRRVGVLTKRMLSFPNTPPPPPSNDEMCWWLFHCVHISNEFQNSTHNKQQRIHHILPVYCMLYKYLKSQSIKFSETASSVHKYKLLWYLLI